MVAFGADRQVEGAAVRIRRTLGAAVALVSLGAVLAACVPPPPPPPPLDPELPPPPPDQGPPPGSPTITRTDFVTGLDHPWDMSFLSDGTMFFTERSGPVKVRLTNGTINNIVTPADVAPAGEGGTMGVTVDPNFAMNRFLYTCYTAGSDVLMTDLQTFPNAMIPAWRSGDTGTVAPSGATFLTGAQWESWNGALAVAFLKDSNVRVMFLDGNGDVSFATPVLSLGVRLRSAVQGPDGNLYLSTDSGGGNDAIWKVTPS
jgi:glucose/arabinose dehydrogenase